ncbi:MAG TPA: hypothetical protein VL899_12655 [Alphaproteobacteria bacterium]|nr:hypothetical protein [Alphaproteobacteria bacterium]
MTGMAGTALWRKNIKAGLAATVLLASAAPSAMAAQTKGFVVSWFNVAEYADPQNRDCPHGVNDGPEIYYRRELKQAGLPQAAIDKYINEFLDLSKFATTIPVAQMRGKRDGKPADVYADPESMPDPKIKLVEGPMGYGFNLDGKVKPADFTDPETGEKGVDNQLYRVIGCINELKTHTLTDRPPLQLNYWNVLYEQMPAWLIEISGIEDPQNSPDVTVTITRAYEPPTKDSGGNVESNLTFTSDPNPRWHNVAHGRIKDGVLTTDNFDMNMQGDPFWIQEFHFKEARIRAKIDENGNLRGFVGGYHPWFPFYWQYGSEGWGVDATNNVDLPGLYYALKKSADADPDPKTGQNRMISSSWLVEAVPAFVTHPKDAQQRAELSPTMEGGSRGK